MKGLSVISRALVKYAFGICSKMQCIQAEKENEDAEYRAKCEAVNAARHQAQLAACTIEKSLAYENFRMLKQNWNQHVVRHP